MKAANDGSGTESPARRADARRPAGAAIAGRPLLDIRTRWRAGQVALGLAVLLVLLALLRPLAPGASPWLRLFVALALGLGTAGTALLTSLRGRGRPEHVAFYIFIVLSLDAVGQLVIPLGWPVWPLMVLLLAAAAVAEPLQLSAGMAALASLMAIAQQPELKPAVASTLAYFALVLATSSALKGEKKRLSTTLAELARLRHGIDQLDDDVPAAGTPPARFDTTSLSLRQVSEEGRRQRHLDRASELDATLDRLVRAARASVSAHSVLYFELDRERESARLRACAGPPALVRDTIASLTGDPFAFVLDRKQAFYATDFKRLLWALPWYKGEVKIGSLLVTPVRSADVITGVLVADRLEVQSLTGVEPEVMESLAAVAADAVMHARASLEREEMGVEFKAVYAASRSLTTLSKPSSVRHLLLRSARDMVPLEAAAVVMVDEAQTRYVIEEGFGWAREFEGREVGLSERTWAAWVLRSAQEPYLLDQLASHEDRMPILVLDEGKSRAESLLAVPLKARDNTLGALILTGKRGAFDATAHRVLGVLANQGAALLSTIQLLERNKERALRDGLTGLYNRRAFDEFLSQGVAREDRRTGSMGLMIVDIDHFKKLNDTYGHPAGDAALRNTAHVIERMLRKGDQAARFGGEEFAVLLPGTAEIGALNLAERLRAAVEEASVVFEGARISVTISLGLAVWPNDAKEPAELLAAADRALYTAKSGGRNRVATASQARPTEGA